MTTDGRMDEQRHNIIRPVFRRAYKKSPHRSKRLLMRSTFDYKDLIRYWLTNAVGQGQFDLAWISLEQSKQTRGPWATSLT
jgi:hypothetical protein